MTISCCHFVWVFKLKPISAFFVIHLQSIYVVVYYAPFYFWSLHMVHFGCYGNWWFVLNSEGATSVSVVYCFSSKYWPTDRTSLRRLLFATNFQSPKNISAFYKTMACSWRAIDKKINCTLTSLYETRGMNCSILWVPCMKHLFHSNSEWPIFRINSLMASQRWCHILSKFSCM
jgi:hypothetical protein